VTQAGYYGIPKKIAEQRAEDYLEKLGLWENAIFKPVCFQVV
jgi:ABC-2 type transport system ATP-binding protein